MDENAARLAVATAWSTCLPQRIKPSRPRRFDQVCACRHRRRRRHLHGPLL